MTIGATVTLDHDGYPEAMETHLQGDWEKMFWGPLKAYLQSSAAIADTSAFVQ